MSVTAFPVMARILQEKGLTQSSMGAIGIAAAAMVTVLMFVLVSFASGVAEERSAGKHILMVGLVALYIAIMFGLLMPLLRPLGKRYEEKGLTSEIFAIIAILLFASAYISQQLEVSVIVGGFLAGAILPARISLFKDLSGRLSDITGTILLPIFLAFSGLATDFTKLKPEFWGGIAIFLVAGIVAKWGAGIIFGKLGGLSWAEANVIGILMNCRGLLILVVALIALNEAKVITPEMQVGGVLMALVTTMMTGPLFDRFLPAATAAGAGPPPAPITPPSAVAERPAG
jgi:Kef-type K+ transport system membrane component KefB